MNKGFFSSAALLALLTFTTVPFTSCSDYDDDISKLQGQIDSNQKDLSEKLQTMNTALDQAKTDLTAAKTAIAAAQEKADAAATAAAAAQAAAAQAKIDAIAESQKLINELKATVDGKIDIETYNEKMATIDAALELVNGEISSLKAAKLAIEQQINALNAFKSSIEQLNLAEKFPTLEQDVADLKGQLDGINSKISQNTSDIASIKTELETVAQDINSLQSGLSTLTSLLSHRLTSLVFAPSEYVNGIQTITFSTLKYNPWKVLLADKTDGTTTTSINDGKTTAYYYANPSTILLDDILAVSVLTEQASNTVKSLTKASEIVTAKIMSIDGKGKMKVTFNKETTGSFELPGSGNKENFYIAALKADIKTTQEETDKGLAPSVISDWVRLAETAETPYIFDAKAIKKDASRFYPYTEINTGGKDGVSTTAGKFIYADVPYTATLDLNNIADVRNEAATIKYNIEDHNLGFEFNLVDYNLQAAGEEKTNQKEFAKITDGVISSQSRDGQAGNRSAVGREPMVQIVLRNKTNNEVVDVRYMKIRWVLEDINTDLGILGQYNGKFNNQSCDMTYTNRVGTKAMNDLIYAKLNISKEEFHNRAILDPQVYLTLEAAQQGAPATNVRGTIKEVNAEGATATVNLEWAIAATEAPITAEEYKSGAAHREVYGRYVDKLDKSVYTFKLTLDIDVQQMAFNAGYVQSFWSPGSILSNTNKDKVFQVNPALTDDKAFGIANYFDCQITASLLKGYNKANTELDDPTSLVDNATNARFVFDAERLASLGNGWSVTDNGIYLRKDGQIAAEIKGSQIQLFENPYPVVDAPGAPTQAAISLLGKNVPVKLVASYCSLETDQDYFNVNFINPLALQLANVTESFKDLLTGGSTIEVKNIASIYEAFGLKRKIWENGSATSNELKQWYNVQNVTWDLKNAKTNLKVDGDNIIITDDNMASDWSVFARMYNITAHPTDANAESLTFKNNSGAHIQQAFTIAIPVYAQTKWSTTLTDADKKYIVINITPGDTKSVR